jgi:hypothetical protein
MLGDAISDFLNNPANQQVLIWGGLGIGALIVIAFALALAQRASGAKTWGTEGTSKAGCCVGCTIPMVLSMASIAVTTLFR